MKTDRALSVTQPWASLLAIGAKGIETRSWYTAYRGRVFIHASKGFPRDCEALCWRDPFRTALIEAGVTKAEQLPRGAILASAVLVDVRPTEAFCEPSILSPMDASREFAFGDFSPRRFGWVFRDVRPLTAPIPCKGALGLWTVPPDVLDQIRVAA